MKKIKLLIGRVKIWFMLIFCKKKLKEKEDMIKISTALTKMFAEEYNLKNKK